LHICAEAPFPEKDAFCEVRLLDSRADKILVEYQEACTSQHGQGEQDWQWKGKVLSPSPENRADCEQSKTFCLSC
ncbi:MAG: hypothetical protein LBD68_00810, partial [Zoogloeaceae bacterium]|nr:hypothetical protein [Zoogloeaceae bacterium]